MVSAAGGRSGGTASGWEGAGGGAAAASVPFPEGMEEASRPAPALGLPLWGVAGLC